MVNLVALGTVALSFLAVADVSVLGNPASASSEVDVNLNLNFPSDRKVAAAWWAGWHPDLLPLDKVTWKKYTHITYAFA